MSKKNKNNGFSLVNSRENQEKEDNILTQKDDNSSESKKELKLEIKKEKNIINNKNKDEENKILRRNFIIGFIISFIVIGILSLVVFLIEFYVTRNGGHIYVSINKRRRI